MMDFMQTQGALIQGLQSSKGKLCAKFDDLTAGIV
jgi:hypothetical protein